MDQRRNAGVRTSCELNSQLLEGRSRGYELRPNEGDPLADIAAPLRAQPMVFGAAIDIPNIAHPRLGRSENLSQLRGDRNIGTNRLQQILSIQNASLHQERTDLLLNILWRLLARRSTKWHAHVASLRHAARRCKSLLLLHLHREQLRLPLVPRGEGDAVGAGPAGGAVAVGGTAHGGEHAFQGEVG